MRCTGAGKARPLSRLVMEAIMSWVWELFPVVPGVPVTIESFDGRRAYVIESMPDEETAILQRIPANPDKPMREVITMKFYRFMSRWMSEDPRILDTYHSTLRFPVMTGIAFEDGLEECCVADNTGPSLVKDPFILGHMARHHFAQFLLEGRCDNYPG